jgi:hypothetical protein
MPTVLSTALFASHGKRRVSRWPIPTMLCFLAARARRPVIRSRRLVIARARWCPR